MYPPVDYPVSDDEHPAAIARTMTYASLLERHSALEYITDAMIQSASISMEAAQQLPSVTRPQPLKQKPSTPMFQRLIKVIR